MSTEAFCAQLDMGGAVSVLEALFLKAQSDLSYVACRLQQEFSEEYTAAGCSKVCQRARSFYCFATFQRLLTHFSLLNLLIQLNPLRLLQRLTETRARVESLSSRAEKIQQQRQVRMALSFIFTRRASLLFSLFTHDISRPARPWRVTCKLRWSETASN